jgi:hypothetical protein
MDTSRNEDDRGRPCKYLGTFIKKSILEGKVRSPYPSIANATAAILPNAKPNNQPLNQPNTKWIQYLNIKHAHPSSGGICENKLNEDSFGIIWAAALISQINPINFKASY